MDKLLEDIKKELTGFGEKGINASNVELVEKLSDSYKNLLTAKAMEEHGGYEYSRDYEINSRFNGGSNNDHRGGEMRREDRYRTRGSYDGRDYGDYDREYRGNHGTRLREHMDRMADGIDEYEYGKDRYMHGGDDGRMQEGLEKIMYAVCMFVESAMDFAETPHEKEIIRKHLQKISRL